MKKEVFKATVQDPAGRDQQMEFALLVPDAKMNAKARIEQSRAFRMAMDAGAPLRSKLDKFVVDQGVWDDDKERQALEFAHIINDNEKILAEGGCKLSEGYRAAIEIRKARNTVALLMAERNRLDEYTCEGQGENARFNSLVSQSIVSNDTGLSHFASYDDYMNKTESDVASVGARLFADKFYGLNDEYYHSLPENQFLLRFKFVNADLHLIDKEGRLVDATGRLVNEDGYLIDFDGNLVDDMGNPVDEEGNPLIAQQPFLEDDDNPLGDDGQPIQQEEEPAKKKTPVKKKAAPRKKKTK